MIFGYCRSSSGAECRPDEAAEVEQLKTAGCEKVFIEKLTGRQRARKVLDELRSTLRQGDTIVVASLESLGRTPKQFINLLDELNDKQVDFRCLDDSLFDTTTQQGKIVLKAVVALNNLENTVQKEYIRKGQRVARDRGRRGGRRRGSYDKAKAAAAVALYKQKVPVARILEEVQIARSTLYDYLRIEGVK